MRAVRDVIEQQVVIAAPRERVWAALTDAGQLASWFSTEGCEVDLQVGGQITFHWTGASGRAVIVELDEPRRFAWSWVPGDLEDLDRPMDEQPRTTVQLTLEETTDGGTLVIGRESGFGALSEEQRDRVYRMNVEGWTGFFQLLRSYLAG